MHDLDQLFMFAGAARFQANALQMAATAVALEQRQLAARKHQERQGLGDAMNAAWDDYLKQEEAR